MADKDLQVRFGVGHLSYQKKQRTRITYKSPTQINSPWIGVNCSSAEWYQNRGEGVLNLRRDVDTIGGGASTDYSPFYGNTSVTEVVLPNEITNIGDYAFYGCTNLEKVVVTSEVPPTLGDNVFEDTTTVYVPYEYLDTYGEAWGDEVDIAPIGNYYQITVTAGEHGSATGSGWYALNESVVLTATADEGYEFTQWSDGNTSNPRTITVITDATYTCAFQALKQIRYTSTNQASGAWVTNNTDTTQNTYDSVTGNGVLYLNSGVTTIGGGTSRNYSPFYQDGGLTAVDLDDAGLTTIGDGAFYSCSALTSLTIGSGVTSIGGDAFRSCIGLTSITIPSGVTSIGGQAFRQCTGLTSITIPNSVTSIGANAFQNCTGLTSATIGNGVTTIGNSAFSGCSALTSLTIGSGVTTIGNDVFDYCASLTSINIPSSVTSMGETPFYGCTGLASITVDSNNTYFNDGNGSNCIIETSTNTLTTGCKNTVIPNTVTTIGIYAFYNCSGLTSIDIPSSVTAIGIYAFYNCSGLTSIDIPSSVTAIGGNAFQNCSNLTSVTCEATTPPTLGNANFNASNDTLYVPMESVSAYQSNNSWSSKFTTITNIPLPPQIRYTSTNQATGTWVTNNTDTAQNTYDSTTHEGVLYLNSGVTSIGGAYGTADQSPFYGDSGLTDVNLTYSGLTTIGESAFDSCTGLTSINIPSSVTSIGTYGFGNCSGLTSVSIPDTVTAIGENAFRGCYYITSVTIGSGVTTIGQAAFRDDEELTSVTCLATTPPTLGTRNFEATNDTLYVKGASVSAYQNDASWSAAFTTITAIPLGTIRYVASSEITGDWITANTDTTQNTYDSNTGEGVLYLNSDVTSIGGGGSAAYTPFRNNTSLTSIDFSNSKLTEILGYTCNGCSNLTEAIIGESVTTLGTSTDSYGVFEGCSSLEFVDMGSNVTEVGKYCFYNCRNLTEVNCRATTPPTSNTAFPASGDTLYVPAASVSAYENDNNWASQFSSIEALTGRIRYTSTNQASGAWVTNNTDTTRNTWDSDTGEGVLYLNDGVTTIGGGYSTDYSPFFQDSGLTYIDIRRSGLTTVGSCAFMGCTSLTSINIPSGVTSIGDAAFDNCTSLTSINIPSGVTTIGQAAFQSCTGLTSLDIPDSVTTISIGAFRGCDSLASINIPNGVTSISMSVFQSCTSLTSINIPSSVTSIGEGAFDNCTSLTSINIPSGVTSIGDGAFGSTALISVEIPSGVTSIGDYAFYKDNGYPITVTCRATTPPTISQYTFNDSYSNTLYVPAASVSAYQADSSWSSAFTTITAIS